MRAIQLFEKNATPELVDIAPPSLCPGTVRVAIRACGLNFADLLMQKGTYQDTPNTPFILGMEVSGDVLEVAEDVQDFHPGDRVMVFSGQGGLAEQGVFDTTRTLKMPDQMSYEDAAAFPIAYGTGHLALDRRANLRAGETLLVTGAAGGVGLTAVELGKLMGARVVAQARGQDKLDIAKSAGADHLIDASDNLRERLKELGGVDVVYDSVGGQAFKDAFRACNPEARLLPIGFASGEVPQIPANHLLVKNLTVIGLYIGAYLSFKPDVFRKSLETLIGWYCDGRLKPHVSNTLPLERALEGFELLRSRQATGKVVVTP